METLTFSTYTIFNIALWDKRFKNEMLRYKNNNKLSTSIEKIKLKKQQPNKVNFKSWNKNVLNHKNIHKMHKLKPKQTRNKLQTCNCNISSFF